MQCGASLKSTNRIKIKPRLLNSIRHKQAPAKESKSVPLLPLEHTPLTPEYVRGILAHREACWKSWEHFRRSYSHHQRLGELLQLRRAFSFLLPGNFKQTNCSMCPTTFLMPLGKRAKALQKYLLSKPLQG